MAKLTKAQIEAVRNAHKALDERALIPPGSPDTPAAREARQRRTDLEENFPEAFAEDKPTPIVVAKA